MSLFWLKVPLHHVQADDCLSMFFQLLYIHLFRPFLKYSSANSPLPAHVSPRKLCTHAAATISKLLRLYKRTYGLRQICNIAVYIAHSACTIHLLNLPEKNARRDITHGVRQLEEIAEGWLCARRTLGILSVQVRRWKTDLPEEAVEVLARTDAKYGFVRATNGTSPAADTMAPAVLLQDPPPSVIPKRESIQTTSPYGVSNGTDIPVKTSQMNFPANHMQLSPASSPSATYNAPPQQQFISSNSQPVQWAQTSQNTSKPPQSQTSPSALFGGVDSLLEESRDWWLKDQSALFDSWSKAEPGKMLIGNGVGNAMNEVLTDNGIDGVAGFENPADGTKAMGYMGFGTDTYGYNNGNIYR